MKKCHNCKTEKPLNEFNKNKAKKDGYASTCRECMKVLRKTHYEGNKENVISKVVFRKKEIMDLCWNYKATHPCVDCGRDNPAGLDFDHLRDKEFSVSVMVQRGMSWNRILEEIEKCEVVCAYCHRIRTHERGGWVRNASVV